MSGLSVLIVEDERVVAMDLRVLLQRLGYTVPAIASSGAEALERVAAHRPALVLMDIRLRGPQDGISTAEQIRAAYDIPVVFLTAYADQHTRERVRQTAPYGYLVKPFNEPTLQTTIEMALERHAQERRLRASEQWLATTLASIGDAVVATDVDGRVTYLNPVAERLLGRPREQALGRDVAEVVSLVDGESGAMLPNPVRVALGTGAPAQLGPEARLRVGDGATIPIDDSAAPIMVAPDTLLGAVMVFRDSTLRQQAEQARRAQALQQEHARQHERLRTLAGGIAHDLNNLLMTVMGNAEMARMDLVPHPTAAAALASIETATQRATDLARQLLAYAGGRRLVRQQLDLNAVVQDVVQLLGTTRLRSHRVDLRLAPDLPASLADVTQIRQVVQNLAINAAEAMGERGGTLTVTTGRYDQAADTANLAPGVYLKLTVGDTGSGMDEATRARIFEPFFSTKALGRGLGLAAVEGMLRDHHGIISVASELGAGTTFIVLLPLVPVEAAEPPAQPLAEGWRAQGTALVIDDEPSVRAIASRMLERLGMQVIAAASGPEGLALLRDNPDLVNCVLLDLTMPDMHGVVVAQELRRQRPDLPIVLMSGYSQEDASGLVGPISGIAFLTKPFQLAELREMLRRILGRVK
ncbi:MAG TPA: response regulator [Roseiflexaceae bacterium]|nr:response regulator [Roseiflexaceae bacterium]